MEQYLQTSSDFYTTGAKQAELLQECFMTIFFSGVRYLAPQMMYFTSMAAFQVMRNYRMTSLYLPPKAYPSPAKKQKKEGQKETKDKFLSSHYFTTPMAPLSNRLLQSNF